MFYKNKFATGTTTSSLFGGDSKFHGEILFDDILRLDGEIQGKIIAKSNKISTLFIGKNAKVKADIVADNIIVAGQLIGKVYATQKLEIKKNAQYEGMVFAAELIIQKNSLFHGQSYMIKHLSLEQRCNIKIGFQKKHFNIDSGLLEKLNYPVYQQLQ